MGRDVFYITTPIYYPNDVPHIGHAYNAVATDFIARFHRLRGEEVFHLTGTDEHGLKLQRAAEERGMTAQEWVDEMEPRWREVWARLDIAYDDYIRTTEARHTAAVQQLLNAVHDNGKDDIYLGTYEGLYCVSCEAYYTEDELIDGLCPIHERPVERMVEENYFFRLSAYADRLLEHYEAHPEAVEPETRRNEVLSTIRGGLQDFSISRTTFDWGIPLPWDPKHVCYVWFDALTNYITAAGYADRPRAVRADVAGEHPLDRQGHPAVPRDLLAGDVDGRRRRAARRRSGRTASSRSAGRRCRRRTPPASTRSSSWTCSAWTPTATTSCARSSSGRTAASPSKRWSSATTPTSPTASATSPAASWRCSPATSTASSRRSRSKAPSPTCRR